MKLIRKIAPALIILGISVLFAQANTVSAFPVNQISAENFSLNQFLNTLSSVLNNAGVEEGLSLFETLPENIKSTSKVMYLHSALLLSAGKAKEAKVLGKNLLEVEPQSTDFLILNTMIAKSLGETSNKRSYLAQIIKNDPYNVDANTELAGEQMTAKNYAGAKNYYQKALAKEPNHTPALFGYGKANYYLGNFPVAKDSFERILQINPKDSMSYSYLAKLEAENNNYNAAISSVNKAIEIDPNFYNYWLDLGDYLRLSGKYTEAIGILSTAQELNPDYFLTYVYRGGLYDQVGEYEKAYNDYKMVSTLNPKYYYAFESLGQLSWKLKKWADCIAAYENAMQINKKNVGYPLMICAVYLKNGMVRENKDFVSKALRNFDKSTAEYAILRLFGDKIAELDVLRTVKSQEDINVRAKLLFFMGMYFELNQSKTIAKELYTEVSAIPYPAFAEFRMNIWALENLQ